MPDFPSPFKNQEAPEGELWISEVRYQDPRSQLYVGSPNILRLPDGALLASHDYFGPQICDQNKNIRGLLAICRSEDNGRTWQQVNQLLNACWGALFQHEGKIYHLGNVGEYGPVAIRRSDDGGFTWTYPYDERSGLLFPAGPARQMPNWQCIGPVSHHKGRFFEDIDDLVLTAPGQWWIPRCFQACVISAPDDCDLLQAKNWSMSNHLPFESNRVPDQSLVNPDYSGWLESSVFEAPDGSLASMRRLHLARPNKAALCQISDDGSRIDFDYGTGFVDMPCAPSKFKIAFDPVSRMYVSITNQVLGDWRTTRNRLILASSPDLRHWKCNRLLMWDKSGLDWKTSLESVGFQYTDWQFDGDDIIYLTRTAYDGAHSFHDSNRITYNVVKDFRSWLTQEMPTAAVPE